MLRGFLLSVVLLCAHMLSVFAQQGTQPTLHVQLDTTAITIGDYITATIAVSDVPNEARVILPDYTKVLSQKVSLVDAPITDTITEDNTYAISQKVQVSAYEEGTFYFPALSFIVTQATGKPLTLTADSFKIDVATIAVDTTQDIKPIQEIIEVELTWWEKLKLFLDRYKWFILAGIVVIVALIYFLKKKKKTVKILPQVPTKPVSLQEKYLLAIQTLQQKDYLAEGDYKHYYSELSDILRGYIDERFDVPALELTTQELLKKTKHISTLKRYRANIKSFLQSADLVKFAKASLNHEQATNDTQIVTDFIKSTYRRDQDSNYV